MSDHNQPASERTEDTLRAGLKAGGLSAEALLRIRRATEAEWRASLEEAQQPPRRGLKWRRFAVAASVLLVAGAAVLGVVGYNDQSATGALVGTVARSEAPGIELKQLLRVDQPLPEGAGLRVRARLEVRGATLVQLSAGGNLRAARGSSFDIPEANTLRLERGELYFDIPPGARAAAPLAVITPAGEFRHVGTQFAVAIVGAQTRLRVREGSVLWHAADGEQTVAAGTEVIVDGRKISRRTIPTAGREWAWAESLAPEIEIENRPLREFLEWFSRESGRRLELADDVARKQIDTVLMHGDVRGLSAMEALTAVMAATTLHYELREGAIRVSSTRAPRPNG